MTTFEQTVGVGATVPDTRLSGPGELDLFGQARATRPTLAGSIRPRIALTQITPNVEVAQLLRPGSHGQIAQLGRLLAEGWTRYAV